MLLDHILCVYIQGPLSAFDIGGGGGGGGAGGGVPQSGVLEPAKQASESISYHIFDKTMKYVCN